jgi:hypothetical protein
MALLSLFFMSIGRNRESTTKEKALISIGKTDI